MENKKNIFPITPPVIALPAALPPAPEFPALPAPLVPPEPPVPPVPPVLSPKEWLKKAKPAENKKYGQSEIGMAALVADFFKDKLRYVPQRKMWYIYDGTRWIPDEGGMRTMELLKEFIDVHLTAYAYSITNKDKREAYGKFVRLWDGLRKRENLLKDAAGVHCVQAQDFDKNPLLLNCLNGTLNVETREFRCHRPEDFITKMAPVYYIPDWTCLRWERFVDEITEGDKDRAAFLQKAIGYALTGDTSKECLFILYGPKSRNGKSTFMETTLKVLGDYGRSARPETIGQRLNTSGSSHSEDIARLNGARLVNIAEPDKQLNLSASMVKTLTGNDTIVARSLHEKSVEFRPQFKMFINTNHLPKVSDNTVFASGRIKVIPFNRHFGPDEQDTSLKDTLAKPENLSGVLNWALDGYKLMLETGLDCPDSVLDATAEYQNDNDKFARFITENLEEGSGYEVRTSEAYSRYSDWCADNGFVAGSIQTFSTEMRKALLVERKRPAEGGSATTMIVGHQLKLDMPPSFNLPF